MEEKEIDFIISLILSERHDTEFAIHICEQNQYGELDGQIDRLQSINSAYASLLKLKTIL